MLIWVTPDCPELTVASFAMKTGANLGSSTAYLGDAYAWSFCTACRESWAVDLLGWGTQAGLAVSA